MIPACGFQLRENIALPKGIQPLYVGSDTSHSKLAREVKSQLESQGIKLARKRSDANFRLLIENQQFERSTLSIAGGARSAEYQLRQSALFTVIDHSGNIILGPLTVSQRQTLLNKLNDVTATNEEEAVLNNEMTSQLATELVRQLAQLANNTNATAIKQKNSAN